MMPSLTNDIANKIRIDNVLQAEIVITNRNSI